MIKRFLCLAALLTAFSAELHAEEGAVPRFEIQRYLVDGNSILPSDKVATLLVAGTGKERDFG
ncbi:MAG: hypothetical protein PHD54_12675, partial [Desulfuromonadaceae bacterium]|nr:hypothetical protein [Desulfuromonadaceae bacterium]